jgi:Dyp-type peroxidase family
MPYAKPTQLQGITDLTLFADIKPGLIEGIFESRSYAWRLEQVLKLLDAARRARREADVMPNPFIDGVARLRDVHFFSFAIVPGNKLLLNVTFDGGMEQYMRLIWGPLGKMLDLIFCHCESYPLAAVSSFEDYYRWVRKHEVPSQFFYADSGGTVADGTYLNRLEALQRAGGERPGADLRAAQLALDSPQSPQPTSAAVIGSLRYLKVLYGLTQLFGMPPSGVSQPVPLDHGSVLLRFTQDFLPDLRDWIAQGLFDPGQQFDALRASFERERKWLMLPRWMPPAKRDHLKLDKRLLQAGILDPLKAPDDRVERVARGALVLARVIDPVAAREWLKSSATVKPGQAASVISDGSTVALAPDSVACTVAITCPGLQVLGVHERYRESLPPEFTQGMEARAGILGDVRINHPQQWNRPCADNKFPGSQPVPIDLQLVHLVIQLRTYEVLSVPADDPSTLLPRLQDWITNNVSSSVIEVLSVEPVWSRPNAGGEPAPRDHFGYADGISQPALTPSAGSLFWDDAVKTGELLLGWVNNRGDGPLDTPGSEPTPSSPPWLDFGTFLVIRKIRQYVDRFDGVVDKTAGALVNTGSSPSIAAGQELVRAKLMGRGTDGTPLMAQRGPGANDFDFRHDADGAQCPFISHVRRANPRTATAGGRPPRIVRRGMSYGPPGRDQNKRGVLFMAYNASIAEQFEVIQRWLTGGNSSGVSSSQSDPLLGVPRVGEPAVFRFAHGDKVVRVDLGDQAITKLEWGLYAFVPSMVLLRNLADLVTAPDDPPAQEELPQAETPEAIFRRQVKTEFEDESGRRARWERVRKNASKIERIGKSVMVGGFEPVMQVLKDGGSTYSAKGYGERMKATLGLSPFGQDNVEPHQGHEREFVSEVKNAIANAVSEAEAYKTAYEFVSTKVKEQLLISNAMGVPTATVSIIDLGNDLIAHLFEKWFGVVYGDGVAEAGGIDPKAEPVRCPGHFLVMARNVFSAYPNDTVQGLAKQQAPALKAAVAKWVAAASTATSAPLMKAVLDAINAAPSAKGLSDEEKKGIVANVMLGLPGTLFGSWVKVLSSWIGSRELWRLQHDLLQSDTDAHADARKVIYTPLITTMAINPVADGIWRTVVKPGTLNGAKVETDDIAWLGIGAALADKPGDTQAAEDLLFGGTCQPKSERYTPHACPGRELAIGALLGALAGLLRAGQWAPTSSPFTLSLKSPQP